MKKYVRVRLCDSSVHLCIRRSIEYRTVVLVCQHTKHNENQYSDTCQNANNMWLDGFFTHRRLLIQKRGIGIVLECILWSSSGIIKSRHRRLNYTGMA